MRRDTSNISVVICAYTEERWTDLVAAVASVRAQTFAPREIIVVVDHNSVLMERVRMYMPDVVAVENREPQGLGGARNSGVAAAQGLVVAFLDDDAVATPGWLAQLASRYDDSAVLGVGGAIAPAWQSQRPKWFPEEFDWVVGGTYRGMPEATAPVRNLLGCNMSFRREVFDVLGGFRLGYGCDETEFCIRVRRHWPGKVLLYEPQAKVYHRVSDSRAKWSYFRSRCYFEGGSKAVVSWLLGSKDSLASERAYTFQTLPRGILRGLADTFFRNDPTGLSRAAAIVGGLIITTVGFMRGKISVANAARTRGWTGQLGESVP